MINQSLSSPEKQPNKNIQAAQQQSHNQMLLEYYHISTPEDLIPIMLNPEKSNAYNYVRSHPVPQVDLQNINSLKPLIEYKRQFLSQMLQQINKQMKQKISKQQKSLENASKEYEKHYGSDSFNNSKQSQKQKEKQKKKQNKQFAQQILNIFTFSKKDNKKAIPYLKNGYEEQKDRELAKISNHSYEQLRTYIKSSNDISLCKKILNEKYSRFEIIQGHKIRKQFWLALIGIESKKQKYSQMYQSLLAYPIQQYHDFFSKIIQADVLRTVQDPNLDEKQKKQLGQRMTRILTCYARRNPYVGYCQGMNFIVNFIMTMGFQQEQCFWILTTIIEDIVPIAYYGNMSGVATDIKVISQILKILQPNLSQKLAKLQIDIMVFVLQWLVCLFTSTLPFYLLTLVWDLMLIEGSIALIKTAIILLQYLADAIQQAHDFGHFFKLYQSIKKKFLIQQKIFISKYNKLFISESIFAIIRQIYQKQLRLSKQQLHKNQKQNMKWKQINCNEKWPVCFQQIKKQKMQDLDNQIWVFKQEGGPKIIKDYLSQKWKKTSKNSEDQNNFHKRLVIGRIPHICFGRNEAVTIKYQDGIQLDDFHQESCTQQQEISRSDTILQLDWNEIKNQSSTDFFRRATANRLSFHFLNHNEKKNA